MNFLNEVLISGLICFFVLVNWEKKKKNSTTEIISQAYTSKSGQSTLSEFSKFYYFSAFCGHF